VADMMDDKSVEVRTGDIDAGKVIPLRCDW
jgi:hypothetical protein